MKMVVDKSSHSLITVIKLSIVWRNEGYLKGNNYFYKCSSLGYLSFYIYICVYVGCFFSFRSRGESVQGEKKENTRMSFMDNDSDLNDDLTRIRIKAETGKKIYLSYELNLLWELRLQKLPYLQCMREMAFYSWIWLSSACLRYDLNEVYILHRWSTSSPDCIAVAFLICISYQSIIRWRLTRLTHCKWWSKWQVVGKQVSLLDVNISPIGFIRLGSYLLCRIGSELFSYSNNLWLSRLDRWKILEVSSANAW